ncbi:MAG: hypothetical protein Q8936_05575 [Bacillota bacterium]|nr:hypothetical protein [Bacillota bacterium]
MRNKNIICFATLHTYSNKERQQHIMEHMCNGGNKVVWVNPMGNINHSVLNIFKKLIKRKRQKDFVTNEECEKIESENLIEKSIVILPIHNIKFFRIINSFLLNYQLKKIEKNFLDGKLDFIWTYYPSDVINDYILLRKRKYECKVIYDNVQRLKGVEGLPKYVLKFEEELYKLCDSIFCDSITIMNDVKQLGINSIYRVPQGVNVEDFLINDEEKDSIDYKKVEKEFRGFKRPIIGYIGGIHHSLDIDLIGYVADKCSDLDFVFVGPINIDITKLLKYKNLYFWGYRDYKYLKYYINQFDTCIIPYKVNEFTKGVYPTKMLEYVSMRKKIVSVDLPDIRDFEDYIFISRDYDEFAENLRTNSKKIIGAGIIRENTWESRFSRIEEVLEGQLYEG